MPQLSLRRSLVLLLACCAPALQASHHRLSVHYALRDPSVLERVDAQRLTGRVGERVTRALQNAGIDYQLIATAPAQQLAILKANNGWDCAMDWYSTPERAHYLKISIPVAEDDNYLVVAHKAIELPNPVDLNWIKNKKLRLGRNPGLAFGAKIDAWINSGELPSVIFEGGDYEILTNIAAKQADYGLLLRNELNLAQQAHPALFEQLQLAAGKHFPAPQWTHLLCTMQVPSAYLQAFNKALLQLQKE